jgi:hypothetical protein
VKLERVFYLTRAETGTSGYERPRGAKLGGRYLVEPSPHPTLEVPRGEYLALVPEVASCRWEGIN